MSVFGPAHPLDVDLADLVEGLLDGFRAAEVEAHLAGCALCRVKRGRLRDAPPGALLVDRPCPPVEFPVPVGDGGDAGGPAVGELWLAGGDERMLVAVLSVGDDRVLVVPVTLDVEAADDETLVDDATGMAVHPRLATEVSRTVLVERMGLAPAGGRTGAAIVDVTDPRLEVRECLADRLGSFDGPPPRADHVRSSLIDDLRSLRSHACSVRPLVDWGDVLLAHRAGWDPIAHIDEVGIVLAVFDTPHGLADDADFDAARSVLTRLNCTALVVLASGMSDLADVFDSSSLNYGIDAPSGRHTAPRPLFSGLTPFDAVGKYLDQTTGMRAAAPVGRGPVTRVDVDDILREAAAAALADAVRQGSRFKIVPKRRGYESLAGAEEKFGTALGQAFGAGSVVENLLALVRRSDG